VWWESRIENYDTLVLAASKSEASVSNVFVSANCFQRQELVSGALTIKLHPISSLQTTNKQVPHSPLNSPLVNPQNRKKHAQKTPFPPAMKISLPSEKKERKKRKKKEKNFTTHIYLFSRPRSRICSSHRQNTRKPRCGPTTYEIHRPQRGVCFTTHPQLHRVSSTSNPTFSTSRQT